MTQEDKELLLKDLCARLPYKVKTQISDEYEDYRSVIESIDIDGFVVDFEGVQMAIEYIKPYLFPLSSMTEGQKRECFKEPIPIELDEYFEIWSKISSDTYTIVSNMIDWLKVIDYLNKNHFDYRGLIQKGLAIDCTNLNIY